MLALTIAGIAITFDEIIDRISANNGKNFVFIRLKVIYVYCG